MKKETIIAIGILFSLILIALAIVVLSTIDISNLPTFVNETRGFLR